ncbi:EF-P lysine aminoacylase GenX [Wenzhouxiangella sp. XN201]|uniref:EF-P lysine aminoacylase EpmA n=1 Tax=Wenzhouxiangella sp. XN201 TaxID=2710755 RepID=UPI0013C86A7F|nr:EF-P lysine aminoacylase GenX [Wenzhouxiangella sp. XN201]
MSDWRPTATPDHLRERARLLAQVRHFFAERGVTEVTTPVLTRCGVTDVQIDSVATDDPAGWLRTSPEYFHKRLLAAGLGDLYELGPVFRRGEQGRFHNPEFTLLEWYRVGWSWRELAGEVVELFSQVLDDAPREVRYRSWRDCFENALDINALSADTGSLRALDPNVPADLNRDQLLDWLFATRIQPELPDGAITVVFDYPASQAALARLDPDDSRLAQRFEVFIGSLELANGYQELTDPAEQRRRFERDNRLRHELGREIMPVDGALLDALATGLPECSGVAVGFDRLLMAWTGAGSISEVVPFASC